MLYLYIILGVVALLTIIFFGCYVKTPPSVALIISGLSKEPRILIGRGGFRIPFLERVDQLFVGQFSVDIKTDSPVPTKDFINVTIDAVAKIKVIPTEEGIRLASRNFLNMNANQIAKELTDSLQGNMREIVGTIDLKPLNSDKDGFSNKVEEKASVDMNKLGVEIISCNIQDITDGNGLIVDLGAENVELIRKNAAINKAKALREVAVEKAKAEQESNEARITADITIANKKNELLIREAELKSEASIQQAKADIAYEIEQQEQNKRLNIKTIEAKTEQVLQEQKLSREEIAVTVNKLEAEINKKSDAEKYKLVIDSEAKLEERKRKAEADKYEVEQKALAIKAQAEADKFAMLQQAEGIKAIGEAEAEAIRLKGEAEAKAMDKKAEAYQKYNGAAIVEMMVNKLPEVAQAIADPLKSINSVNIYGGTNDSAVSTMSNNVPVLIQRTMDTMSQATGVDMKEILKSETIDARTNRNVTLDADLSTDKPIILG